MLYFKIENHDSTLHQVTNLYKLIYDSKYSSTKTLDDSLVNNVWYPIDDLLLKSKDSTFNKDVLFNKMVNSAYLQTIVNKEVKSSTYNFSFGDLYLVKNKNESAKDGKYFGEPIRSSTNNPKGNGSLAYPFNGHTYIGDTVYSYKFTENNPSDMYLILSMGNPKSSSHNDPIIKWNGTSEVSVKELSTEPHRYSRYLDITALPKTKSTTTFIAYKDITKPINFYLNDKLIKTVNITKKGTELFTITLNSNDVVDTKYGDVEPPKPVYYNLPTIPHVTLNPNKAELGKKTTIAATPDTGYTINKLTFFADNTSSGLRIFTSSYNNGIIDLDLTSYNKNDLDFANQTIKHSEDIELNTPVYYVLPTIDHVTFEPTKIEYGKLTNVKVTPETGYIINSIHFGATNPNTAEEILNTSYQNGYIKFDLTNISKSQSTHFEQLIKHSEDVKKLEYGTYVLPKINGITFTLNGSPVTSVQLGKYYNFGIKLDSHYSFLDDKGKGLVIKNDNSTTTNLSGWNGNNSLGVHFENYTTADQLKNAYWDINIQKFDHSDEHEKQIPIQLELSHATADKTSILENSTDTITLTADNGYIFDDDVVYYSYTTNYEIYQKLTKKANKQNIIKIDIKTGSFYDYNNSKNESVKYGEKPYIKAIATSPTVKPTGTKSINLYSMTDGELNTFMNSILLQFNSSSDGIQTSLANFLDFVNQVYRIPLNIPTNLLTPTKNVHSGKWNIDVNTNQITQDHFSINFEPIKVTPHYQNANDYNSITVSLVIPFAKEVELNINDVMNNTINITYNIDLLQGKTTIIVNNDTGTIYTNQIDISTQLEFYGLYYDKTIGGLNSTYINNVLQPYISISYHKPITNLISYSTNENGVLKDYNGFVRVSHGTLTGNMNDTEYNEIMNLLYGGIKIGTKRN